jgi:hypothetical protein
MTIEKNQDNRNTIDTTRREYLFHYPNANPSDKCRRFTVAFSLERTENSNSEEGEWLLHYGATIYTPNFKTEEAEKVYCESIAALRANRSPENCKKMCDLIQSRLWNKRDHIKTARDRLHNHPVQFILWSDPGVHLKYYNFRRLEQFILKRIQHYGVSSEATEKSPECTDIITDFGERGYQIMNKELSPEEKEDRQRFFNENCSTTKTNNNSNFTIPVTHVRPPLIPAITISCEVVFFTFLGYSAYLISTHF